MVARRGGVPERGVRKRTRRLPNQCSYARPQRRRRRVAASIEGDAVLPRLRHAQRHRHDAHH